MNNFFNQPGKYYKEVVALTPKETFAVSQNVPSVIENSSLNILFSPFLIYGLIILFFALFLGAIIFQIIERVLTWKSTVTTMVVVFVIVAVPLTLKSALQHSAFQIKAAPDEIPKNVEINQTSPNTIEVAWETDVEKLGSVRIGLAPLNPQNAKNIIANSGKKNTKHKAQISDLNQGILYEIEILSGSNWYNQEGRPLQFKLNE